MNVSSEAAFQMFFKRGALKYFAIFPVSTFITIKKVLKKWKMAVV